MGSRDTTKITIIHFNDVYNIEPRTQEPVGGAARFVTAIKERQHLNPLVLFSGDAFNPSIMSAVTKGKQLVPVLNACNVQCAVYGNHDFDFSVDTLVKMANETTFPWLMSNVLDILNDCSLAKGELTHTLIWQDKKIGFVGLVEEEWIDTLSTIDPEDLEFQDFVQRGTELAKKLKSEGADYVIALTHMRWPNDEKLANEAEGIDLILGGHDHDYGVKKVNGIYVLKSGTDFREFSEVTLDFRENGDIDVTINKVEVNSSIPEDPAVKDVVQKFEKIMGEKMNNILGIMEVELEGRFKEIRTKETNLGNFVTDIMLEATEADCAILNSGTLRSDTVHPKGEFKVKDLMSILPMVDPILVISATGKQLHDAIENSVSQYPKLEGRFVQVSGMSFGFDPTKSPGERVDPSYMLVQGKFLDLNKTYRVAVKSYMANGKDGFTSFKDCQQLVDEEKGPRLCIIVQNHFSSVRALKGEKKTIYGHRQSLVALSKRKRLVRQFSMTGGSPSDHVHAVRSRQSLPCTAAYRRDMYKQRRSSLDSLEIEHIPTALAPQVEGRIYILNDENRRETMNTLQATSSTTNGNVSTIHSHRALHNVSYTVITEEETADITITSATTSSQSTQHLSTH